MAKYLGRDVQVISEEFNDIGKVLIRTGEGDEKTVNRSELQFTKEEKAKLVKARDKDLSNLYKEELVVKPVSSPTKQEQPVVAKAATVPFNKS